MNKYKTPIVKFPTRFIGDGRKILAPLVGYVDGETFSRPPQGSPVKQCEVSDEDLNDLFKANTANKLAKFLKKFEFASQPFFGKRAKLEAERLLPLMGAQENYPELSAEQQQVSLRSFRDSLVIAFKIQDLLKLNCGSLDDFKKDMEDTGLLLTASDGECHSYIATLSLPFEGAEYAEYLRCGCEVAQNYLDEINADIIVEQSGVVIRANFFSSVESAKECCSDILDTLAELHMHDVSTSTQNGIPYQRANSISSALWYCNARAFRGGRETRCIVCNKPFIATNKRGQTPKFCSPGCEKKYYANKDAYGFSSSLSSSGKKRVEELSGKLFSRGGGQ